MTPKPLVALCVLVLSGICFSQQPDEESFHDESKMPSGETGQMVQKILDTLNSNDAEKLEQFLNKNCTKQFREMVELGQHIAVFNQVFRETGGVVFHSIRTYKPEQPNQLVVIVKDKNFESWRGIIIQLNDTKELVDGLGFRTARTPTNVKESSLTEKEMVDVVDKLMKRLSESDVFSGTVLIAKRDDVLFKFSAGEASKRFHVPNNIDTKFNLGSMNKMFTATAIAQLVEKGVLAYDDPISKYVDESWLPTEISKKITIHHLLTHTSGLGSYFNDKYWQSSRENFRSVDDFKELVQDEELAFEPGSRFRYSNTGMLMLGVIIEKATEQSYFDYIREHIYKPAGMSNTDSYEMDSPVENLAIGYVPDKKSGFGWQNNVFKHVIKGGPAGGGFSTVGDLHRFARALQSGKLVSDKSLKRIWTDHSKSQYGYGFSIQKGDSGLVVGHGGGFPGLNGNLDIFVDKGYIAAVLANYGEAATPVAEKIKQLIGRIAD